MARTKDVARVNWKGPEQRKLRASIRLLHQGGFKQSELGRLFGIKREKIGKIVHNLYVGGDDLSEDRTIALKAPQLAIFKQHWKGEGAIPDDDVKKEEDSEMPRPPRDRRPTERAKHAAQSQRRGHMPVRSHEKAKNETTRTVVDRPREERGAPSRVLAADDQKPVVDAVIRIPRRVDFLQNFLDRLPDHSPLRGAYQKLKDEMVREDLEHLLQTDPERRGEFLKDLGDALGKRITTADWIWLKIEIARLPRAVVVD